MGNGCQHAVRMRVPRPGLGWVEQCLIDHRCLCRHVNKAGSGGQTLAAPGIRARNAHSIPGSTHRDHDGVPGGREDVRVVVALVVLGELLGEEFAGELEAKGGGRLRSTAA